MFVLDDLGILSLLLTNKLINLLSCSSVKDESPSLEYLTTAEQRSTFRWMSANKSDPLALA